MALLTKQRRHSMIGFQGDLAKLSFCMLLVCILLPDGTTEASHREFQLFDEAYYSYLSYQPKKAVEEFTLFLEEFPDSSAKDAALFWLAKSLLQIKSVEEAKKTFAWIKEQFPESPFSRYAVKELDTLADLPRKLSAFYGTFDAESPGPVDAEYPVGPGGGIRQEGFGADSPGESDILRQLLAIILK